MSQAIAPEMSASPQNARARSPYVGLVPYTEEDAAFFFGRERERKLITANLLASRLTLLYGSSGVGKTSVLRAGVVRSLGMEAELQRSDADASNSGLVVVMFSSWRDDPMTALHECIAQSVARSGIARDRTPVPPEASLVETLRSWTDQIAGQLLIILDQFEEYFLYHAHVDGDGTFAREFPRAVNRRDLDVNFLVSIREDALARLDRFKGRIPSLFDNYLRLEHLGCEAARAAIEQPIAEYNRLARDGPEFGIEPALVEAVLQQVRAGQLVVGQTGSGTVKDSHHDSAEIKIETSHLQVVMTRLWREEISTGSHLLRFATLERLGGSERIVQAHLDEAMDELPAADQDLAARVFNQLVTPSGTKIAHTAKDLAGYAQVAESELTPVLERLSASDLRILRPVAPPPGQPDASRFEIFHDVLATAILDWRARHLHEQDRAQAAQALERERQATEEQARQKVRRALLASAVMASLLVAILAFFALEQAKSIGLAREAESKLGSDPAASVRTALDGLSWARRSREAEDALRRALAESHVRAVMRGHRSGVNSVAFSPDGRFVLTASLDGTARVWNVNTGQQTAELSGHTQRVNRAVFSPDGTRIVTASNDGTARLWDTSTGEELAALEGHGDTVRTAAFSSDGSRVVTASWDGTARVWDVRTGTLSALLTGHNGAVTTAQLSPDGAHVVTAGADGTVRVWDTYTGEQRARLDKHASWWIYTATFSPDGKSVVTASADAFSYLWRWETGEEPISLKTPTYHEIRSAAFSPDGRLVVTTAEKRARVYKADTEEFVSELRGHTDWVNTAAFSADSRRVVTVSRDGTARVWEVSSGATLAEFRKHADDAVDATFSPDGALVATASADGTARVWALPREQTLLGYADWVISADFSPDGKLVVGAGQDGIARVWRVGDGGVEAELAVERTGLILQDAAFSPDGRLIATVGTDGRVRVWDWGAREVNAESRQPVQLTNVGFSPAGDLVVTAGGDNAARIWEWQAGQPLRLLVSHEDPVRSASFSPDGTQVVTS